MSFTSVLGHLMELDFNSGYRPWRSCRPIDLFNAPVEKHVPQVGCQAMILSCTRLKLAA